MSRESGDEIGRNDSFPTDIHEGFRLHFASIKASNYRTDDSVSLAKGFLTVLGKVLLQGIFCNIMGFDCQTLSSEGETLQGYESRGCAENQWSVLTICTYQQREVYI